LESSGSDWAAAATGTSQASHQTAGVAESIHVSQNEAHSTSVTVSQPPSTVSLQIGEANTLKWSAFFGVVVPLLNVLFV